VFLNVTTTKAMRHSTTIGVLTLLLVFGFSQTLPAVWAQEAHEMEDDEEGRKNEIAVFVGGLSNVDSGETGLGFSVDYARAVTPTFAVGAIYEFAFAVGREHLIAPAVFWGPGHAGLKLFFAPGVVFVPEAGDEGHAEEVHAAEADASQESSSKTAFVARFGIGYRFITSKVLITPILYLDLIDGGTVHLVYGVAIGFPF